MTGYGDSTYADGVPFGGGLGTPATTIVGGIAVEGETALAGTATVNVKALGGIATETDSAPTGGIAATIVGGVAVEGETALPGGSSVGHAGGVAVEGETGLPGSVRYGNTTIGGVAVEGETALAGQTSVGIAGGFAAEAETALAGKTTVSIIGGIAVEFDHALPGGTYTATVRWRLHDPSTGETWIMPINPDSMTPTGQQRNLNHARGRYGVTTIEQPKADRELGWGGVIRSQAHYDALVNWARRDHAVIVSDHVGRSFRVYITDFDPTDRSPIPRAPKRWRYTMKTKLLEAL